MHVLFVCRGNLCRSPLAEALTRHLAPTLDVTSAGTAATHEGELYDQTAHALAACLGLTMHGRVRRLDPGQLSADLIVCADGPTMGATLALCSEEERGKVHLLREWDPEGPGDVPNPSGEALSVWDSAYASIDRSCRALVASLE